MLCVEQQSERQQSTAHHGGEMGWEASSGRAGVLVRAATPRAFGWTSRRLTACEAMSGSSFEVDAVALPEVVVALAVTRLAETVRRRSSRVISIPKDGLALCMRATQEMLLQCCLVDGRCSTVRKSQDRWSAGARVQARKAGPSPWNQR